MGSLSPRLIRLLQGRRAVWFGTGPLEDGDFPTPQVGFTVDPDAIAVYQFEENFLEFDSIGGNSLTASGSPTVDLVDKQELDGAIDLNGSSYLTITDANQSNDYPLKNGQSNELYTVTTWLKLSSTTGPLNLWGKSDAVNRSQLFRILSGTNTLSYSVHTGVVFEDNDFGVTLSPNIWYHIALEVDHSSNSYRLTVFNDDTQVEQIVSVTGVTNVSSPPAPWSIGADGAGQLPVTGTFDEYTLTGRVLGALDIRQIRAGTYDGPLAVRTTSFGIQTLFTTPETDVRVSDYGLQVLATVPGGPLRVTSFGVQALVKPTPVATREFPVFPTERSLQSQTGKRVFPV